ncbi:MAG: F0F1 ATP synthase subunit B' [Pseudomonadota bacterium]
MADTPAEAAEAGGLPQLDFSTFPNQIFWLVITLVAIYLILNRVAIPRISAVLAERSGTITNDLVAAEELKQRAADAEAAYEKALADARASAQKIAADAKAEMQAQIDDAVAKADAEIAAKASESEARVAEIRDGALAAIEEVAKATTGEVLNAMGGKADASAIEKAVAGLIKE